MAPAAATARRPSTGRSSAAPGRGAANGAASGAATGAATARPVDAPSSAPSAPRRPPLRVFEPAPRRRTSRRTFRRSSLWMSCILVVGSLLTVVMADAYLAQGQVRLASLQAREAAASTTQKSLQVAVASMAAPPVVVSQAESHGLVAPAQVVYLPEVPLNVPLPVPHTTPAPTPPSAGAPTR